MKDSRPSNTHSKTIWYALAALALPALQSVASAQQDALIEGEKWYESQCMICHGQNTAPSTAAVPARQRAPVHLAMRQSDAASMTDVAGWILLELDPRTRSAAGSARAEQLAFSPPYGPNLRGIVGRPAGTVEGFGYSKAFLKALKGMIWTEGTLDWWILNTQAWVPGTYMYYKQPDAEIRRMIIDYLRANP